MNKPLPWNINGVGFDAREAARDAARRQGKSLGEWLHGVIADHAADTGIDAREMPGQKRIEAVTSKLERLSSPARQDLREPARVDDLAQWRADRAEAARDDRFAAVRPTRAEPEPRRRPDAPAFDADALLEDAVEMMERRARRAERHTDDALRSFSKMLERNEAQRERERESVNHLADKLASIETRLSDRLGDGEDNPIKGALARLEARLDTIGRRGAAEAAAIKSAAVPKPASQPERLNVLEDKLNSILEAVTPRQAVNGASSAAIAATGAAGPLAGRRLGDAIADIAKRQRSLDSDASAAPLSLRQAIGRHRETPADEPAPFVAMQREIAALATKIEDLRHDVVVQREARRAPTAPDLDGLRGEIGAMSKTLRDLAPRGDLSALETSMRALGDRIEDSRGRGMRETTLRPVERVVGDLHRSLDALDPRRAIGGLERDLRALDGRIEGLDAAAPAPAAVARIQDQMQEIRDLVLATAAKPLATEHIEKQLAMLNERFERELRHPSAAPDLGAATEELRSLIANPPGAAAFTKIESKIEALASKIDRAVASAAPAPREISADALESLVRDLSDKMEAARAPGAGDQALKALQDQIGRLSARFEQTDSGLAKLGSLERSMRDLFAHLDETRASVETSAARAAREVLRIAMEEGRAASEHGAVTSLTAMKALQDEAEARTSSTLSAVHETLKKVVDRLSSMENDLADVRPRAPAAPRPAPQPAAIATGQTHSAPPAPAPARPAARPKALSLGAADPLHDQILGQRGTAKASAGAARGAPIDLDDENGRADFIAAARRAAKAAQTDPSFAEPKEAPFDAPMSGAPMSGGAAKSDSAVRAGLVEQSRAYVARHKRPVLLSIAALFVIVGTMAVMQRIGLGGGDAQVADANPPARIAQMAETAPPARPMRQNESLTPSALPRSAPALAAQIPGSDPIQTGSIPSLPSFAAGPAAPPPRATLPTGLTTMAENGDGAAEYVLGTQYAEGRLLQRDFASAARWYQKAADQGIVPAQYRLAALYEKGLGVTQDKFKARTLYREAAEAGNPRAMHNLAVLLADGDGKPDYDGAATWFRKAAQFGIHDSQYNLAILLARGLGVQQSLVQSYQWFSIAATQNDADAAKKRDEVATKLSTNDLAVAKALAGAFRPRVADVAATEVQPPPGGWDGAPAPTNLNSARHKISSL